MDDKSVFGLCKCKVRANSFILFSLQFCNSLPIPNHLIPVLKVGHYTNSSLGNQLKPIKQDKKREVLSKCDPFVNFHEYFCKPYTLTLRKILLIEDNPNKVERNKTYLEGLNCHSEASSDGTSGLQENSQEYLCPHHP
jgi:hypothetical protein